MDKNIKSPVSEELYKENLTHSLKSVGWAIELIQRYEPVDEQEDSKKLESLIVLGKAQEGLIEMLNTK